MFVIFFILLVSALLLLVYPRAMMMPVGVIVYTYILQNEKVQRIAKYSLTILIIYLVSWRLLVEFFGEGNVDALKPLRANSVLAAIAQIALLIASSAVGGLALVGIVLGYGQLGRLLSVRPLIFAGNISYSFYLWHIPVMGGVKRIQAHLGYADLAHSQLILFATTFPISLAIAVVSYELIEKRLSKWLRAFYKGVEPSMQVPQFS